MHKETIQTNLHDRIIGQWNRPQQSWAAIAHEAMQETQRNRRANQDLLRSQAVLSLSSSQAVCSQAALSLGSSQAVCSQAVLSLSSSQAVLDDRIIGQWNRPQQSWAAIAHEAMQETQRNDGALAAFAWENAMRANQESLDLEIKRIRECGRAIQAIDMPMPPLDADLVFENLPSLLSKQSKPVAKAPPTQSKSEVVFLEPTPKEKCKPTRLEGKAWDCWNDRCLLSVYQACMLSLGFAPTTIDDVRDLESYPKAVLDRMNAAIDRLKLHGKEGVYRGLTAISSTLKNSDSDCPNHDHFQEVDLIEFRAWCNAMDWETPPEFTPKDYKPPTSTPHTSIPLPASKTSPKIIFEKLVIAPEHKDIRPTFPQRTEFSYICEIWVDSGKPSMQGLYNRLIQDAKNNENSCFKFEAQTLIYKSDGKRLAPKTICNNGKYIRNFPTGKNPFPRE